MKKKETEKNIWLPESIANIVSGLDYEIDHSGLSNSSVLIYEDYVVKISSLSFDVENEVRVSKVLEGKLPIGKLITSETIDGVIYALREKLKGKSLCDEEYMNNPALLYKLAGDALRLLWKVNIDNLDLQDTLRTIIFFGERIKEEGLFEMENHEEVLKYLKENIPDDKKVLCHGDLCLPNIICEGDEVVGFIDLGLTGISGMYHDISILNRSIRDNFNGTYGRSYPGYKEEGLFEELHILKDLEKQEYYLLLDEILG